MNEYEKSKEVYLNYRSPERIAIYGGEKFETSQVWEAVTKAKAIIVAQCMAIESESRYSDPDIEMLTDYLAQGGDDEEYMQYLLGNRLDPRL